MDPWIINDMINRDDLTSTCSSGESSISNFDPVTLPKPDLNKVFLPPDKVVELMHALAANPKAFIKPQEKRKV
jgi:hypothetical protein